MPCDDPCFTNDGGDRKVMGEALVDNNGEREPVVDEVKQRAERMLHAPRLTVREDRDM